MAARYKITATIVKSGNLPVKWTRYSGIAMTRAECEKMFSIPQGGELPVIRSGWKISAVNYRCPGRQNSDYKQALSVELRCGDRACVITERCRGVVAIS